MKKIYFLVLLITFSLGSCNAQEKTKKIAQNSQEALNDKNISVFDTSFKTIHILTALCDNKYQGIVPVPKSIGNGQDPKNNLYWGCQNGILTYFPSIHSGVITCLL